MTVSNIQLNLNTQPQPLNKDKKATKSYLESKGAIKTEDKIHPLPPQGHLIHDSVGNSVKYFFKDIGYDLKSLKNGFNGTANDHQSGRLNDVGLVVAGIMIATYLASKTTNPKARVMEYVGLGAFLTAMSIYPKIAINTTKYKTNLIADLINVCKLFSTFNFSIPFVTNFIIILITIKLINKTITEGIKFLTAISVAVIPNELPNSPNAPTTASIFIPPYNYKFFM